MRRILASGSPRRKQLLSYITSDFEIMVSNAEEILKEGLSVEEQSKQISYVKAKEIFDKTRGDRIVIGSDTMVVKGRKIYGKPKNEDDAFNMISELQDNEHQVITSISILIEELGQQKTYQDYEISKVYLSEMTEQEIRKWINSGKAMDKAGAYAIQEEFSKFIKKIDGNYDAVVGLPTHKVYGILKQYI